MFDLSKAQKPWANPLGINTEEFFDLDNIIVNTLPKVLEFFLKSNATSNILPEIMVTRCA